MTTTAKHHHASGTRAFRPSLLATAIAGTLCVITLPVRADPPPVNALPQAAAQWITSGAATSAISGNNLTIQQTTPQAILNWQSFDIGRDASVHFDQAAGAAATALNRIGGLNPSQIFGKLSSTGQVYLINRNGILFGNSAQVNVGGLVASTLDIDDQTFLNGILSAVRESRPAFTGGSGEIVIEAGAYLRAADGQRILIFAPNVTNHGRIETPNGQTVLAAGNKVYIAAIDAGNVATPELAGQLLVEVDVDNLPDSDLKQFLKGEIATLPAGNVTNAATGSIDVGTGNATLVGLALSQSGRISATTAVRAAGSIRLVAQDKVTFDPSSSTDAIPIPKPGRAGRATLGAGSVTEVLPDLADATTDVDVNVQVKPNVRVAGAQVFMERDARIVARGGNVTLIAQSDPRTDLTAQPAAPDDNRIYLAEGSRIDVSGLSATLPMDRNALTVKLTSDNLKDAGLNREVLRGQTITVDVRNHGTLADGRTTWVGTPLANLNGDVAGIRRGLAERLSDAGSVTLASQGDVIVRNGAAIDVSGGTISYAGGLINTTKLTGVDGRLVDIGAATPDQAFQRVAQTITKTYPKWGVTRTWDAITLQETTSASGRFESGYVHGADAGSATILGQRMAIEGVPFVATTIVGPYQRNAQTARGAGLRFFDELPLPGYLQVGDPTAPNPNLPDLRAPTITLAEATLLPVSFDSLRDPLPAGFESLLLSPRNFGANRIGRAVLASNGGILVPGDTVIDLPPGGSLALTARDVDIAGAVRVPGGTVSAIVRPTKSPDEIKTQSGNLNLRAGAQLLANGQWVNDSVPGTRGALLVNGGNVTLSAEGDLVLDASSIIDVRGGGYLSGSGALRFGNGGNITLEAKPRDKVAEVHASIGSELRGHAPGKGGTLSITANRVCISGDTCPLPQSPVPVLPPLALVPGLFESGGFGRYRVTANLGDLTVVSGTTIAPRTDTLVYENDYRLRPTGTDIGTLTTITTLPDALRPAASLELRVRANPADPVTGANFGTLGVLNVEDGARIVTDPGASVTFATNTRAFINGEIVAPAGTVTAQLESDLKIDAFVPAQTLWIGSDAHIVTAGAARIVRNARGEETGDVLAGGTVNLLASRGYVVVEQGATVDVSGTTAELDLVHPGGRVEHTLVGSAAGTVNLLAAEGIYVDGDFTARAGATGLAGGTVQVSLDPANRGVSNDSINNPFPTGARQLEIRNEGPSSIPTGLIPGASVPADQNGAGRISTDKLQGFDSLNFSVRSVSESATTGEIRFAGGASGVFSLSAGRQIVLDAATINGNVINAALVAPYISVGSSDATTQTVPSTSAGTGTLSIKADLVDLIGNFSLNGVNRAYLESTGDIRLRGVQVTIPSRRDITGSFNFNGELVARADQIYATTLSAFDLVAHGAGSRIKIQPGDGNVSAVLSAGSKLRLSADEIVQGGTLRAPIGEIVLDANESLTLASGSVTSTSAEGATIPFGQVQAGESWTYQLGGRQLRVFEESVNSVIEPLPSQRISLDAGSIALADGAVIDVSGGGDLAAYEWVPGIGGTRDVLAATVNPNLYAILPGKKLDYAPYDTQEAPGVTLKPGDSIYLAGADGLPEGTYTLLPARYALLPGAWLVSAADGYRDIEPGQTFSSTDGTTIVAGYRATQGTGIRDARTSGFSLRPGETIQRDAEYQTYTANEFFTARAADADSVAPRLPQDGGAIAIAATTALDLEGSVRSAAAAGGRGATLDISADKLAVVASAATAVVNPGFLKLDVVQLSALGVNSLLIGGTRSATSEGSLLTPRATEILIATDASTPLAAREVILAAKDVVTIADGSHIEATGVTAAGDATLLVGNADNQGSGDAGIVALSAGSAPVLKRTGATGSTGSVSVASNTVLKADGGIVLDASKDASLAGTLELGAGAELALGAQRISLGAAPVGTSGLVLDDAQLAALNTQQLANLSLRSATTLDLYGNATLSGASLEIAAQGLSGFGNAGDAAHLTASKNVTIENPSGTAAAAPGTGAGTLDIAAGETLVIGAGESRVTGFASVALSAGKEISARGEGTLAVDAPLVLTAPVIAGEAGATTMIAARDAASSRYHTLTLQAPAASAAVAAAAVPAELGVKLAFEGANVTVATMIDVPSGIVTIDAKGTGATDDVTLQAGANINVAGRDETFYDTTVYAPAGDVRMTSASGSVRIADGASVDVSGDEEGGTAGSLEISAARGAIALDGTLLGNAAPSETGARIALDALNLPAFTVLNDKLNASGFHGARDIRARSGDLDVAAADTVTAHTVKLAVDAGAVRVAGRIDASGAEGGEISLYARDDVVLAGSARLDARATDVDGNGGKVTLSTNAGQIEIAATDDPATATIDVSGGISGMQGGRVHLRAPRVADGVAVRSLAGTIRGADRVELEAVRTYAGVTNIDATLTDTLRTDTDAYMTNAANISTALGKTGDASFHLLPGIELQSSNALSLDTNWDLKDWRFNGEPGVLTLRAAGDVNINQSLSDGFDGQTLRNDRSWSYRIVAGADPSAADPLAVNADAVSGTVQIAAGTVSRVAGTTYTAPVQTAVRTGTGNIEIAAAGNLGLGNRASVIYTAGRAGSELTSTDLNQRPFPVEGGDISIRVGGDIVGAETNQLVTEWQHRVGSKTKPAEWVSAPEFFESNVGALGGGDVRVTAQGDIKNLSAASATSGNANTVFGGGALNVRALGDVLSGIYYVGKGHGTITAGDSIRSGRTVGGSPLHTILALGDGQIALQARRDIDIETVLNPTVVKQGRSQRFSLFNESRTSYFFTYGSESAVNIQAVAGDAEIHANVDAVVSSLTNFTGQFSVKNEEKEALSVYSPILATTAISGDIRASGNVRLFPASRGDLALLAGGDVRLGGFIQLSDTDVNQLPTRVAADLNAAMIAQVFGRQPGSDHALVPVHAPLALGPDPVPARLIARTGDFLGNGTVDIAKSAIVFAGRDIQNLNFFGVNIAVSDVTRVIAGRDVVYASGRAPNGQLSGAGGQIRLGGPGELLVQAGRDVDLGTGGGIETQGNTIATGLPDGGASANVLAGVPVAPDYAAFDVGHRATSGEYRAALADFAREKTGDATLDEAAALTAFDALPVATRDVGVLHGFFAELRASGRAAATGGGDYSRGFDAVASLFPGERRHGDINLVFSKIYTLDGGSILTLAPGGGVNAGLASAPEAFGITKPPSELGIVAQSVGNVFAFQDRDYAVNESRVFAADGGDVLVWSSNGDIDAGRGAKSAISAPPRQIKCDEKGVCTTTFPAALSGSGIRSFVTTEGRAPGSVDLFAPAGIVNAGEAGIGAAGNITIGATQVIGADNISFGGVSVGVPVSDSGAGAAALAGVSSVASSVAKSAEESATSGLGGEADTQLSVIEVEVIGFGE